MPPRDPFSPQRAHVDAATHPEAKARRPSERGIEEATQRAWVAWARKVGLLFTHPVANSVSRAKGFQMSKLGVEAGTADIVIWNRPGLALEFKGPTGRQSKRQREFQRRYEAEGGVYRIVRTAEEAKSACREYLALGPTLGD